MKVKISADGITNHTKITTENGTELDWVKSVKLDIIAGQPTIKGTIEFDGVQLEATLDLVPTIEDDFRQALRLLKIHKAAPNLSSGSKGHAGGWCDQRDELLDKYSTIQV